MNRILVGLLVAAALSWSGAQEAYDLSEVGVPVERYDLNQDVVLPEGAFQVDATVCMFAAAGLNLPAGQNTCLFLEAPDEDTMAAEVLERFGAAGYVVGDAQPVMAGVTAYRLTTTAWAHSLLVVMNTNSPGYLSVTIALQPELR